MGSPSPEEQCTSKNSKRKAPDHPSPSSKTSPEEKVSVKETRAKFELTEKYRIQRNAKDLSREKAKFKGRTCKKQVAEVVEDPIAKMLHEMHADIKEIKLNQKNNKKKIDGLSAKVANIEVKANETDLKNNKAIEDLRGELSTVET